MVASSNPTYQYRLDEADVIVWVDRWWLAFAKENGAAELDEPAVLGHSIWDFVTGEATQTLYRELHAYVRSTGNPIAVPFRCDSPLLQRYMQLTITRRGAGDLHYESTLLRAVPQRRLRLLDSDRDKSTACLTMCSCCKRSLLEPSGWLDLEHISLRLRLFDEQTVPEVRYTICPQCAQLAEASCLPNRLPSP